MNTTSDVNTFHTDEADIIHALLQQLYEAWGNADTYASLFTEDADYVAFDGSLAKGREAIAESHRPLFEGILKDSRLVGETSSIRFVAPDVALVHSKGAVLQKHQQQPSRRARSIQTTVVVRQNGHWLISAFQNTRYRPWNESLLGKVLTRLNARSMAQIQKTQTK